MKYLLLLFSFSLFSHFSYSAVPTIAPKCPYGFRNDSILAFPGGSMPTAQCLAKTSWTSETSIYSNFEPANRDSANGLCYYSVVSKNDCAKKIDQTTDIDGCYPIDGDSSCDTKTCTLPNGGEFQLGIGKSCDNYGYSDGSNPNCGSGQICSIQNGGNPAANADGSTGGGDGSGGDVPAPECTTGLPDDSNTLSFNECTGETIQPLNPDPDGTRESNESQCGIGNHIENGVCVKDQQGCGYVGGFYSCFETGDNCGTYTDLEGNTQQGCFDPAPNIYDPDKPKQQPVVDPVTGDPVLDPVTGDPVMEDAPSLNVDMSATNKKLDELKQSSLNLLNEQKKTNQGLGTANNHLNAINQNTKAILKENVKTNSKLDKVNENLEGLTEEVSDNKEQELKDKMNNDGETALNDSFSAIESGLNQSVSVAAPDSIKSNLESFVPDYEVCSSSIPLDFGIYQANIKCERFEEFKKVFGWFLYGLTFYSLFGIALRQTEK